MGLWPPGAGKSIYSSVVFPTHYLGRFPRRSVILASYGSDLPKKFGRRARSIIWQPIFKRIFDCELSAESGAADAWALTNESEWIGAGILTGITGNRADGVIWDDLIKGREQADSDVIRQKTWDAYLEDLLTRKKPTGWEVAITCMTGDTPVTMADGTKKLLRDIKAGDSILTLKNNRAVSAKVINWKEQGPDEVFEIKTGGSTVKANARHPFLVYRGKLDKQALPRSWTTISGSDFEWVRVKDLKNGDFIVTNSKIPDFGTVTLNESEAWLLGYMFGDGWITERHTIQKGYKGRTYPRNGYVTTVAMSNYAEENDKISDLFLQIFGVKLKRTKYHTQVTEIADVGRWFLNNGLKGKAKTKRLPNYLFSEPTNIRLAFLEGFNWADGHTTATGSWALTSCNIDLLEDIRHLARGVGFRVTNTWIKQCWMQAPSSPKPTFSTTARLNFSSERSNSHFFARPVKSITKVGREEVFDLQVEDTECFIADGLVSHNTRWHEDDIAGRILPQSYNGESGWITCRDGNDWYVVCLPAECERADDPLGRQIGEILWPEWFSREHFAPFKRNARTWNALFQQRPAPEEGDFFLAEWLKPYTTIPDRKTLNIYGASDYAVTADGGDYTVHIIVGVDPEGHVYVLDLWRAQTSADKWIEALCDLVEKWRPLGWAEETGQIKAGIGPFLIEALRRRRLYLVRAQFPTRGDKRVRAQAIRGRMAMDGLYVPVAAPWYPAFKRELMVFDAGANDDMVDALGLIGQVLDKMIKGAPLPSESEKPKILSTDPSVCTVTLVDLFEANEHRSKSPFHRIH